VKKVGCQDLVGVLADELAQGPLAAAGYRLQAMASEHLAHGEMGTAVAQLEQLGNDPSVAPTLVSPWPASSEIVKLAAGPAATRPSPVGGPVAPDQLLMPAEQCPRLG
jgi:hypothetical protein